MQRYGYFQKNISDLSCVDGNTDNWYNYKEFNFLTKFRNRNTNLVIFFHGALPAIEDRICCFRGFNYEIENTDIISVSDLLISIYQNFQLSWFFSSAKHNITNIYIEVFDSLLNRKPYNKVIFTGTSGGGYPSLYFSSFYKKTALIANAQIYPEHYWHYKELITKLTENNDKLLYENKEIEKIILNQQPEKIYLYQNLKDHCLKYISNAYYSPFVKFIKDNNLDHILHLNLFNGIDPPADKTHHNISFPKQETHLSILNKILSDLVDEPIIEDSEV
jgi:predicted esterase YcpF (UPF0227 family)